MFTPFFVMAAQSPGRQQALRRAIMAHVLILGGTVAVLTGLQPTPIPFMFLGQVLLILGIIEGATLLGWRLAQLPKSQSLELLFMSPLRPRWLFVAELLVGLARIALVTLSGLPLLLILVAIGLLTPLDLVPLLLLPFTLAVLTGLTLIVWAYEHRAVRRWGQRFFLVMTLVYLIVGVLAGEKLTMWLHQLPEDLGYSIFTSVRGLHRYNPFSLMRTWLDAGYEEAWEAMAWLEAIGLLLIGLLTWRGAARLQGHFQDRHYSPSLLNEKVKRPEVGETPLTWWAVKRVTQYSGGINIWLAGGFSLLYAAYTLAGSHWPTWLGRSVFQLVDRVAGLDGLTTALVVLAAVPAAFQYGLWDANAHDRCKRLELLLLTQLRGRDYWNAAAAAAWKRGRGYLAVAGVLWLAGLLSGAMSPGQVAAAMASAVLLWSLYFALGFRAFARGAQANGLGMVLTVALPLGALVLGRLGFSHLAALLPPGSVYSAGQTHHLWWIAGAVIMATTTVSLARHSLRHCEDDLRRWYDQHHGQKVVA